MKIVYDERTNTDIKMAWCPLCGIYHMIGEHLCKNHHVTLSNPGPVKVILNSRDEGILL